LAYYSTLKKEAACSSKTSVKFQRTTRHYIADDRTLHNHSCENPKSYRFITIRATRFLRDLWEYYRNPQFSSKCATFYLFIPVSILTFNFMESVLSVCSLSLCFFLGCLVSYHTGVPPLQLLPTAKNNIHDCSFIIF
jgi:hypothetical protein